MPNSNVLVFDLNKGSVLSLRLRDDYPTPPCIAGGADDPRNGGLGADRGWGDSCCNGVYGWGQEGEVMGGIPSAFLPQYPFLLLTHAFQ